MFPVLRIENDNRISTMTFFFLIFIKARYPSATIINDFSQGENNNFNLKFSADFQETLLFSKKRIDRFNEN